VTRLSGLYGKLLAGLALAGCAVLFAMMLVICLDVLLRNARIVPGMVGIAWANEVTEYALYLITILVAPWLLRQGQHIRIDIVLRVIPRQLAWTCEWLSDLIALVCCVTMGYYGTAATLSTYALYHAGTGGVIVKTLSVPEWWLLAALPACFALLALEIIFRMGRLYEGVPGPREDAVSTG
jgi:TRAP-type C4-dicarboxylate transport system permease small subunit